MQRHWRSSACAQMQLDRRSHPDLPEAATLGSTGCGCRQPCCLRPRHVDARGSRPRLAG